MSVEDRMEELQAQADKYQEEVGPLTPEQVPGGY
jgi:hypothetical protein